MIYIFWTCASTDIAKTIVQLLLEQKLIACASFFPVESHYTWQGKIEQANEMKVLLKTLAHHFSAIEDLILQKGGYSTPEIVQIHPEKVSSKYLDWICENV